jgi:hypothetical protein
MTYTPKHLTEQEEGELLGALTRAKAEMGVDAYNAWADKLILQSKAYLLKHATEDNPALIRLKQLILIEERGFL